MNNLVSGKAGISAEMAIRLEKAFGGGAETWLRMQVAYDLALVGKRAGKIRVRRVKDVLAPAYPGTREHTPPRNHEEKHSLSTRPRRELGRPARA